MLPLIVTVCPSTGKMPRLAPVPTTTLPVTVNVVVRLQLALAGTMRLPLTVLPLGVGGQVVSAARATGSATNRSPNASIAVSKCFMVFLPPVFWRGACAAHGRPPTPRYPNGRRVRAQILDTAGPAFRKQSFDLYGNLVRMPGFHPRRTLPLAASKVGSGHKDRFHGRRPNAGYGLG